MMTLLYWVSLALVLTQRRPGWPSAPFVILSQLSPRKAQTVGFSLTATRSVVAQAAVNTRTIAARISAVAFMKPSTALDEAPAGGQCRPGGQTSIGPSSWATSRQPTSGMEPAACSGDSAEAVDANRRVVE